jgi:predicted regulator of Ras-like GTPase activity (Roadblock/LC7/MglB family)
MSVQPQESASRAGRLDRILRDLLHQTPGVEAAAVVSFDGLPMASALPVDMDEDRVAAMSAALLSLAERAAQGLGRGDLSQVYIEGEHGTVFLVSAQDEGVLIAVTTAGSKVGMMLYEVKLAANRVGEVLHGPAPLPAPLPANVTRHYLDEHTVPAAAPVEQPAPIGEPVAPAPTTVAEVAAWYTSSYSEPSYSEPAYSEPAYSEPAYSEPVYAEQAPEAYAGYYTQSAGSAAAAAASSDSSVVEEVEPAPEPASWSSYAPSGSVLPSERSSWS